MYGWVYAACAVVLGVVELVALLNDKPGDTISEKTWQLTQPSNRGYRSKRATWLVWAARIGIGGFLAWLTLHVAVGL